MKWNDRQADAFLRRLDPAIRAVLVHGSDQGLLAERVTGLTRAVAEDPSDPFRVAALSAGDLRDDPARLQDEAQALSMMGGRRVVSVRGATDGLTGLFQPLLALDTVEALVVVEAGELNKRSSLRKLFEEARNAAALACYADDAASVEEIARDTLAAAGLKIEDAALAWLAEQLGSDRLLTRRELEKLVLYKGAETGPITLDDVQACVGRGEGLALDDIAYAAADGNIAALNEALRRAFAEGLAPVAILRMASNHIQKLHLAVGHLERGANLDAALGAVRPPIFYRRKDAFKAQARRWDAKRLTRVLALLTEAEIGCKTTGMPDRAICERALFGIAAAARGGKSAPRPN